MKQERPDPLDPRLVRALSHPVRIQILEILSAGVASPKMLAGELETRLSQVSYHTRALEHCGCVELVETAQRHGVTEHFYKAKPEGFIGSGDG